jgi:catechol 2,3-dioxygenase-like lactoylglutathione lyase family enzyme
MISYVTIGVNDISSARIFYDAVLGSLGHVRVYEQPGWLGYTDAIGNYMPRIWVCNPIDGKPATVGNGSMVGLHAKSPEEVNRFHAAGLAHGGHNEGDPGRRGGDYQPGYYLAYLRDPDGNKLAAFCNTDLIKPDGTYDPQPIFPKKSR